MKYVQVRLLLKCFQYISQKNSMVPTLGTATNPFQQFRTLRHFVASKIKKIYTCKTKIKEIRGELRSLLPKTYNVCVLKWFQIIKD